jgi:hypothetical protein
LGNTGAFGAAENYMQVFVRREYIDADGDGLYYWDDCDDNDPSITAGFDGSSPSCPAVNCSDIKDGGHATVDDNYWIDPDGSGAFEVYCDLNTDNYGWTVFMVAGSTDATPNTSSTIINPSAAAYSYMSHSEFDALCQSGDRIRAWNANDPDLWLECDFQTSGSDYKDWEANANCIQQMKNTAGSYVEVGNSGIGIGFIYSGSYDAINPSNFINDHSIFMKANASGCCAGSPPKWTAQSSQSNGSYTHYYGDWTNDYSKRLIYAIRTP